MDVTDVTEPDHDEPKAAPVPWYRRPAALIAGIAGAALLALIGGLIWAFSGDKPEPDIALKPIPPSSVPDTETSGDVPGLDLIDGLGGDALGGDLLGADGLSASSAGSTADASMFATPGGSTASVGSLPAVSLPPAQAFQPPAFELPPAQDWPALLQPVIQAQQEAAAANLGGAIGGPVIGAAWGTANTAALVLSDLILFAAANPNGGALLNQLDAALPALLTPSAAAALTAPDFGLGAPDFSGLTAAFAAAAGAPPIGVPELPALPPPPPGLPTPEQALAGLAALPAVGLPALPPPPGLPTPEQALAGLFVLPAIGLPALPPPPPIGLPQLPPPPPIGLPSFGFPSFGLPSITRLLGLPF